MRERAVQTDQAGRHARPAPVRVPARPVAFLALAAAIGNRAAAQVARAESGAGGAGPAPAAGAGGAGPAAARDDPGAEGGPGVQGFDIAGANDQEKVDEIRRRLADGGTTTEIWNSFPDRRTTAEAHPDLWHASARRDGGIAQDAEVEALLKERVEGFARERLQADLEALEKEMAELGVGDEPNPGRGDAVARLQEQAGRLREAERAKEGLRKLPVGWSDTGPVHGEASEDETAARNTGAMIMNFDPAGPPPRPAGPDEPGFARHEEVRVFYNRLEEVSAQALRHPALFALQQDGGLDRFEHSPIDAAERNVASALHDLRDKVRKAHDGIGGEIDFRDLRPVHEIVEAQAPFTQTYESEVAAEVVRDHEDMKTLRAVGLGVLQLAGLFTTGGLSWLAILAAGASGAQANLSWEEYQAIKTAREARVRPGEELATGEQYDDAQLAAVLDIVFAFLDGFQAARARAEIGLPVAEAVRDLARLALPERDAVLSQAMTELGPGAAIEAAGGIAAVRETAAGTSAAARAETYVAGIEDALAAHLGELPEGAALLPEAQRFVAERSDLPPATALHALKPEYADEPALRQLLDKLLGTPVAGWKAMVPEQRAALVHSEALARLKPPPKMKLDPTMPAGSARWDPVTWTISYAEADFTRASMTERELVYLKGNAVHEAEHGQQVVDTVRVMLQRAPNRAQAVAGLKAKGWDSAVVDAADAAPPLNAAGMRRAAEIEAETVGWRAQAVNTMETLIVDAKNKFEVAQANWESAKAVERRLTAAGAHPEKIEAAAAEVATHWNTMEAQRLIGFEYETAAIEREAFAAQRAYVEQQLAQRKQYMEMLVAAGLLVELVVGAGIATYVARRSREPAQSR